MNPGLQTTIGADARPLEKDLAQIERMTMASIGRMENRSMAGGGIGAALERGSVERGLRGARAYGGASSSMFISVARDTAASLASGANPVTVFMQQGPQVAQALTMMGLSISSVLTNVIPALASLGSVAMAIVERNKQKKAEDQAENTKLAADAMGYFTDKIAVAQLRKYSDRLNPGESDQLVRELFGSQGETRKQMVEYITWRINQVRRDDPTTEQSASISGLDKLNQKMMLETMSGFAKQRMAAKLAFEERKKQIEELQKKGGDNVDAQNNAITAFRLNRETYKAELDRITNAENKTTDGNSPRRSLTERQQIGALYGGSTVSLIDVSKQHLGVSKEMLDVIRSRESVIF